MKLVHGLQSCSALRRATLAPWHSGRRHAAALIAPALHHTTRAISTSSSSLRTLAMREGSARDGSLQQGELQAQGSEPRLAVEPRVLSIQSHVVHGYVGNKCAVLPLQLLGFDVDPIYSVQFSNHTGYPAFKGSVFDGQHLMSLLEGLQANGLVQGYTHLLTGYIGSVSLLERIAQVCKQLRAAHKDLIYVCDPVLGDEGRLYASPDMVEAFRSTILPHASLLVPNQFEAELLTRRPQPIRTVAEGFGACDELHALGPHTVVITSLSVPEDQEHVVLLASTTLPQDAGVQAQKLTLSIPRIKAYFTGTGDLMAALLLAWTYRHPGNLQLAVEKAVAGLQAVLQDTARVAGPAVQAEERTAQVCKARELRLVQNQAALVDPQITLRCKRMGGG